MANAFQTIKNKMGKGDTNLKRKWQMVSARRQLGGRGDAARWKRERISAKCVREERG